MRQTIANFLYWLGNKLFELAFKIEPKPTFTGDLADLIVNIEPIDTPFLRNFKG